MHEAERRSGEHESQHKKKVAKGTTGPKRGAPQDNRAGGKFPASEEGLAGWLDRCGDGSFLELEGPIVERKGLACDAPPVSASGFGWPNSARVPRSLSLVSRHRSVFFISRILEPGLLLSTLQRVQTRRRLTRSGQSRLETRDSRHAEQACRRQWGILAAPDTIPMVTHRSRRPPRLLLHPYLALQVAPRGGPGRA